MRLVNGRTLCLSLALAISACRSSTPPKIDVCLGDGVGGADCQLLPGSVLADKCEQLPNGGHYCPPSALLNAWITTNQDMAKFAAWCHEVDMETTEAAMAKISTQLRSGDLK